MKKPNRVEGQQVLDNFKRFAGAILQANPKKKKQAKEGVSQLEWGNRQISGSVPNVSSCLRRWIGQGLGCHREEA